MSIVRDGVDRQTADDPHTLAAPLNSDDRELLAFYATQIDAHAADVDALAVVERYRFEARVHGVQQAETAATSTLAHVSSPSRRPLTRRRHSSDGRMLSDIMREDTIVEVAAAVDKSKDGTTSTRSKDGRAAEQRSGRRR